MFEGMNFPISYHGFLFLLESSACISLPRYSHGRTCVNVEWELVFICRRLHIYFSPCLLISRVPSYHSAIVFYFISPQILAIIDLGLFSHLLPSSDTVIFPCPRIYIIDLTWSTSLWQMFLFQFQLDWLWFADQFESWQAPK